MTRLILILAIVGCCANGVFAQKSPGITALLSDTARATAAFNRIDDLKRDLGGPVIANDRIFLQSLFKQVHRSFLKKYVAYSEIQDLFTTGNFDCLTATALFSQLLADYRYDYSLIETNYHIFIVVHSIHGDVLLETTDRVHGFVTDEDAISDRIGGYRKNQLTASASSDKKLYAYHTDLYRELSPDKLPGLLHFNQAIRAFNNSSWLKCAEELESSRQIYDTPRNGELAALLIRAVWDHEHDASRKKEILSRLQPFVMSSNAAPFEKHLLETRSTFAAR